MGYADDYVNREMSEDQWEIACAVKDSGTIERFTEYWRKRCGLPSDWGFSDGDLLSVLVNHIALDLFRREDWVKFFDFCKKYGSAESLFITVQLMRMRYRLGESMDF